MPLRCARPGKVAPVPRKPADLVPFGADWSCFHALDVKTENFDKPRTLVAETYDNLVYTIKIARKPGSDDYYLSVAVSGEPPRTRTPEKNEKPADKERLDKQFDDALKRLDERLKLEKGLAAWTYVVPAKTLEPLIKARGDLVAAPRKK